MKEWMAQANPPKESSTFERMNNWIQMLSSKKMTQYFKEWTTPISVLEKRLQSCFCSMFKTTGQKSSNAVLLSRPVEKISMVD